MAIAKAKAKFAAPPGAGKFAAPTRASKFAAPPGAGKFAAPLGPASSPPPLEPASSPPPLGPASSPPPPGAGKVAAPPWGRQRRRRIRRLLHLRTTLRTSWHLRVIARRSESILVNAARECRANICYYVAHVDYIQYISGLKPIGEGVIFVISTATTAAGELRACATILGMGIIYEVQSGD